MNDHETVQQTRIEHTLERELQAIDSPQAADAVVARIERGASGTTEQQKGEEAAADARSPAAAVESAAETAPAPPVDRAAQALLETAAQAVAPTTEAPNVVEAAREVMGTSPRPTPIPVSEPTRSYLREAVLRRMGPFQALDAKIFLFVNELPHPDWANRLLYGLTVVATGGWIWAIGVYIAAALGVPRSMRALRALMPSLMGATWIVEYPIKAYFRRQRPFIEIVRALVIGKKPGSWSFPSGHTAASFAAAWVLTTVWPRRAPLFFGLAGTVGFSRVYLGAHYPGDVMSGATLGIVLAEAIRRGARLLRERVEDLDLD
jgi:membrane-associated phospholipid phosphatase